MDFKDLMIESRLSIPMAAELFQVHTTSIYRWLKTDAPTPVKIALSYRTGYAPGWEGFLITPGTMICPDGCKLTSKMLSTLEYQFYLQREIGYKANNRPNPPDKDCQIIEFPLNHLNP